MDSFFTLSFLKSNIDYIAKFLKSSDPFICSFKTVFCFNINIYLYFNARTLKISLWHTFIYLKIWKKYSNKIRFYFQEGGSKLTHFTMAYLLKPIKYEIIRDIYETGNICALKIRFQAWDLYRNVKRHYFTHPLGLLPLSSIWNDSQSVFFVGPIQSDETRDHAPNDTNCRLHHCIHIHTIHTYTLTHTDVNLIRPVAWACPSMFTIVKHIARRKLQCCRFIFPYGSVYTRKKQTDCGLYPVHMLCEHERASSL